MPIRENPKKWTRDNPLTKEEILKSIKKIKQQNKEPLIGFFPGFITRGKYKGKYSWAIDFDEKDLVEKLQIRLEQCKRKGVWLESSKTKGHHLYGISDLIAHDEKLHNLSIELFGTPNTFIMVYGNFKHDLYDLTPQTIEKDWKKLQNVVKKIKGITTQVAEKPPEMEGIEADCIKLVFKGGLAEGKRNDTAFALANWYKNVKKMNPTEIRTLVNSWNKRNKPALSAGELNLIIVSAQKSGKSTGCSKMQQLGFCPYKHIKDCLFLNPQRDKEELEKKKTINIPIGNKSIQVKLLDKNEFQLNNGKQVVFPATRGSAQTVWYTSSHYRGKIANALIDFYEVTKKDAEKISNDICSKVQIRIHELNKEKAFKKPLGDELQAILKGINKVECTRSEDNNIYQIHIDGEIIRLKDKELYFGPSDFCVQYLNRFFKKIIIDSELWNEDFIPCILSEDMLVITEQKVESNIDVVREKFFQYVKNKKVLDWKDMDKRVGYKDSIYYDGKNKFIRISSALINSFFEREKISATHRVSIVDLNNNLREKNFLIRKRLMSKVKNETESFWIFKPEDLEITEQDVIRPIVKKEKKRDKEKSLDIEEY